MIPSLLSLGLLKMLTLTHLTLSSSRTVLTRPTTIPRPRPVIQQALHPIQRSLKNLLHVLHQLLLLIKILHHQLVVLCKCVCNHSLNFISKVSLRSFHSFFMHLFQLVNGVDLLDLIVLRLLGMVLADEVSCFLIRRGSSGSAIWSSGIVKVVSSLSFRVLKIRGGLLWGVCF